MKQDIKYETNLLSKIIKFHLNDFCFILLREFAQNDLIFKSMIIKKPLDFQI